MTLKHKNYFTVTLLKWFSTHHRPMPWKGSKDPYTIWLSEIILQQTRVSQGTPYFEKFIAQYPSVYELASATEDEILKLWQGLGYYSRARNMLLTAKRIVHEFNGNFPADYKDILSLKGVGPYTAAAIASFAFDKAVAVVDGNVYRVLSRFFGIDYPTDSTEGKKFFKSLAEELLDIKQPATYNQALMDFGATQCLPKSPECAVCPLHTSCFAAANLLVDTLPVKSRKLIKRDRFFTYLVMDCAGQTVLQKRKDKDIWQHLYEFPLIEEIAFTEKEALVNHALFQEITESSGFEKFQISKPYVQQLTHQKINARFVKITVSSIAISKMADHLLINLKNLDKFALPKIIDLYLRDKSLYLEIY